MFQLHRIEDETGISGTGIVAEGVEFGDGTVALRWCTPWPTSVVFHDRGIESVEALHGHGGKTRIVWLPRPAATLYRTGRTIGNTLYRQWGETPSDGDEFIGSTTTPEAARWLVHLANQGAAA